MLNVWKNINTVIVQRKNEGPEWEIQEKMVLALGKRWKTSKGEGNKAKKWVWYHTFQKSGRVALKWKPKGFGILEFPELINIMQPLRNEMGFPWWCGQEVSVSVPQNTGLISTAWGERDCLRKNYWKDEGSLGCQSTSLKSWMSWTDGEGLTELIAFSNTSTSVLAWGWKAARGKHQEMKFCWETPRGM